MMNINIPCSKSYAQRAIICAALCSEPTMLHNVSICNDILSCIDVVKGLGAKVDIVKNDITITPNANPIQNIINAGESGTTCRMIIPILATYGIEFTVFGTGSLMKRDMSSISDIFDISDITYRLSEDGRLPISVNGHGFNEYYILNGESTSQYISGLLIALAKQEEHANLIIRNCGSYRYVAITIEVLKSFGIDINSKKCNEHIIEIEIGKSKLVSPKEYTIEGDWSSFGAIYLAGSLLGKEETVVSGLNIDSNQADKDILYNGWQLFENVKVSNEGIVILPIEEVKQFDIDISTTPDLFPYYAGFATLSREYCKISGLHKLVNKECNRGQAIYEEFNKIGIPCYIDGDSIYIKKGQIKDVKYNSHNDHRIEQVMIVMKLMVDGQINNDKCLEKSYPEYINDIKKIYGEYIRTYL